MFPIEDLTACVARARAAFLASMPALNAWLWPNNIGPVAKVLGGIEWNLENRIDFIGQQAFALTATGKYLEAIGAEYGLARKTMQPAVGNIAVTTTGAAAAAAGATFQRGDGWLYAATSPASITGAGAMSVPVAATLAGLAGSSEAGTPMTIVSGITGPGATGATAAVDSIGLTGGADVEPDGEAYSSDVSTYRGRILFRKRNPTQGGAPSDYVQWASAVPGVTRVYVEKLWRGPGTVRVFPLFDGLFPSGIPDPAHLALVDDALQALAPAACVLVTAAATAQTYPITVSALNPSTGAAQAAVTAEVNDAFLRLGAVAGICTPYPNMPYLATPYTFLADWAQAAVANAAGVIGAHVACTDTPINDGAIPVPNIIFV